MLPTRSGCNQGLLIDHWPIIWGSNTSLVREMGLCFSPKQTLSSPWENRESSGNQAYNIIAPLCWDLHWIWFNYILPGLKFTIISFSLLRVTRRANLQAAIVPAQHICSRHSFCSCGFAPSTTHNLITHILTFQGAKKIIFTACHLGKLKLQPWTKPVETNHENAYFFLSSRQKLKPPPNECPISPLPLSKVV